MIAPDFLGRCKIPREKEGVWRWHPRSLAHVSRVCELKAFRPFIRQCFKYAPSLSLSLGCLASGLRTNKRRFADAEKFARECLFFSNLGRTSENTRHIQVRGLSDRSGCVRPAQARGCVSAGAANGCSFDFTQAAPLASRVADSAAFAKRGLICRMWRRWEQSAAHLIGIHSAAAAVMFAIGLFAAAPGLFYRSKINSGAPLFSISLSLGSLFQQILWLEGVQKFIEKSI